MSLPTRIGSDACDLALKWKIDDRLARMLVGLDLWAAERFKKVNIRWPGLFIISGYRSSERQATLNPEAPNSLHTRCPAMAADLRIANVAASISTEAQWQWLGAQWKIMGGRWGGDFSTPDLNHFDLGVGVGSTSGFLA